MSSQPQASAIQQAHPCDSYQKLKYAFTNIFHLFSIKETLALDLLTAMPPGAVQQRSGQISNISKRVYVEIANDIVAKLLSDAEAHVNGNEANWDEWDLANLREMRRIYLHFSSNPAELYSIASRLSTEGSRVFAEAKEKNSMDGVLLHLQNVVDVQRKILSKKKETLGLATNYDVVLDGVMRGLTIESADQLIDASMPHVVGLCEQSKSRKGEQAQGFGSFSKKEQMEFSRRVIEELGFEFNYGKLFVTNHMPASGGTVFDTRLLVRCVDDGDFKVLLEDSLFHGASALYIQALPKEWVNQPVCEDLGSAMLEAQGLLMETIIGRSPEYMGYISNLAQDVFGASLDVGALLNDRNKPFVDVKGTERGELGSLPYLIISYGIERDLLNGDLSVNDLEARWVSDHEKAFGEKPANNISVLLQNPTWLSGRFGLSAGRFVACMIAAQLHRALLRDKPDVMQHIAKGQFDGLRAWLVQNIWSQGRLYSTQDLLQKVSGAPLSQDAFLQHLSMRFGS